MAVWLGTCQPHCEAMKSYAYYMILHILLHIIIHFSRMVVLWACRVPSWHWVTRLAGQVSSWLLRSESDSVLSDGKPVAAIKACQSGGSGSNPESRTSVSDGTAT